MTSTNSLIMIFVCRQFEAVCGHVQPLEYDWDRDAKQLVAAKEFGKGNFLKGCKWSVRPSV